MHRMLFALALVLTSCRLSIPDTPAESPGIRDARFAQAIDASRAIALRRARTLPGLAVAVAVDGTLVWTSGFGWADVEARRPMPADAQARVYSVAKPMTAALALRLAERGTVDLERQLSASQPFTLAQILNHTSGIRHYRDGEWLKVSSAPCASPNDALAPFRDDPLLFAPGSKTEYSSFGYVLASATLETAARRPFHALLADEVLSRAAMRATVADTRANEAAARTVFYEEGRLGGIRRARAVDNSCKFGAGGLLSTAPDLASFGAALLAGRIVSEESLPRMTTANGDYALGFGVATDETLGPFAAQSGAAIGGMAYLLLVPRGRIVVAMVASAEGDRFRDEAKAIARAFAR